MRRLLLLSVFFVMSFSAPGHAQTFDLTAGVGTERLAVISLDGLWRFHTGDDPNWAKPTYDDSKWSLLHSDRSWNNEGYRGYSGIAWYRFQLALPRKIENVSFTLPIIATSYEVFVDGSRIGSYGTMPPKPKIVRGGYDKMLFQIPRRRSGGADETQKVTIAIRVWNSPRAETFGNGGPEVAGGFAGESSQMERLRDLSLASDFTQQASQEILGLLFAFAALGALSLFLLRRKEYEYFWFSLRMGGSAIFAFVVASVDWRIWNDQVFQVTYSSWAGANTLLYIAFFVALLRPRRGWLFKTAVLCTVLEIVNDLVEILFPAITSPRVTNSLDVLLNLPSIVWILLVIIAAARRREHSDSRWVDARLLLLPFLLKASENFIDGANFAAFYLWHRDRTLIDYDVALILKPFPVSVSDVIEVLSLLCFFGILVLRFSRTRGEQERYASEVEGARNVQQFLIPEDLPYIPGLTIEADYRPALEVGGDFFQVIPDKLNGSALILVGDVAGKGLQAGMLATLLVGAVRTAATFTTDPAIILRTLNNRLHNQGNATALALRISNDGQTTLVNAGHLPPYVNGLELNMEGALPLGTIPDIDFPVLHFTMNEGDTLTLISDGILEAQKSDGELFGFERILAHIQTSKAASTLAEAAQSFGQSDDITVLTITKSVTDSRAFLIPHPDVD